MLDPYGEWLGISEERRPISYYELLGVVPSEADPQTIVMAALTRSERVRAHQSGPDAADCARLLKEIEQAKETLLDSEKRTEYDRQLKASGAEESVDLEQLAIEPVERRRHRKEKEKEKARRGERSKPRRRLPLVLGLVAAALLIPLLIGGAIVAYFGTRPKPHPAGPEVAAAKSGQPAGLGMAQPPQPIGTKEKEGEKDPPKADSVAGPGKLDLGMGPKDQAKLPGNSPLTPLNPSPGIQLPNLNPAPAKPPEKGPDSKLPNTGVGIPAPSELNPNAPSTPGSNPDKKQPEPGPSMPKAANPGAGTSDPGMPAPGMPGKFTPPKEVAGESLEQWLKKLRDPNDSSNRDAAIRALPYFGDEGKQAIPAIIYMMVNDPDFAVRVSALIVLTTNINSLEPKKQIPQVVTNLNALMIHPDGSIKYQAVLGIARMGILAADNPTTLNRLREMLKNSSSYQLRCAAASALAKVASGKRPRMLGEPDTGPDPKAIEALVGAIGDLSLAVRVDAVHALIAVGPPAMPADWDVERKAVTARIPREPDPVTKLWLRVLLMRLTPSDDKRQRDEQLTAIGRGLDDPRIRTSAAYALGSMGKFASSQIFALRDALKDGKQEDLAFAAMCLWAIGQMGPDAKGAEAEVRKYTMHNNETIKNYANDALSRIGGVKK
jgi:HEAT repeat protein